jgi:hypothetical protein
VIPVEAADVTARLAVVGQQVGHTIISLDIDTALVINTMGGALIGLALSRMRGWSAAGGALIGAIFWQSGVHLLS